MQVFHLLFVNFWCLSATAFKYTRRAFKQCPLSLMDHRRMRAEPTGQLANRLLAFQRLQRDLCLEFWMMLFPF
ncbi:hypothetical protein A9Q94_08410 [Rhodobacterales bacterium 56_14_T64]|nr:hypothetical protein A9Q94_08410 [Rhodobacterales bacterium 56_14_T64]